MPLGGTQLQHLLGRRFAEGDAFPFSLEFLEDAVKRVESRPELFGFINARTLGAKAPDMVLDYARQQIDAQDIRNSLYDQAPNL
jgi:hypothetical protein